MRSNADSRQVRVAIAQSEPIYLDSGASLAKALRLIEQAKQHDAGLVAFGEAWIPGYPAWLDICPDAAFWDHKPTKQLFARLRENSIVVSGPEVATLCKIAGDLKITVVIGINERVDEGPGNGTLYNTILTFTPEGKLGNHHRKLVPTYSERMIWGNGDGGGLTSVKIGAIRVGSLICWEHWMPLARMAMHNSGEAIHVAVWPTAHELHQLASRNYAFEGRCFVLAVGLLMQKSALPSELAISSVSKDLKQNWIERGGSSIIAPDSRYVVEPVFEREELIIADLDLSEIDQEVMSLDVTGHYARPDVSTFKTRIAKR
jgi:nitrilase